MTLFKDSIRNKGKIIHITVYYTVLIMYNTFKFSRNELTPKTEKKLRIDANIFTLLIAMASISSMNMTILPG